MEFNKTKQSVDEKATTNFEGGEAFEPDDPRLALTKMAVNNLLENKFYESGEESLERLQTAFNEVAVTDEVFPLKLAAYCRQTMFLRDVPQVLLVLAANTEGTKRFVKQWAPQIIQRADEPCTVVAIQLELFGKPIPKPLRKGINRSLFNFDEYQFSKYLNTNRQVNHRDVFNLTHPNPSGSEEHEEIFRRIMKGDLDTYPEVEPLDPPETWEVVISDRGSTKNAWLDVSDRMGIFAKIRNIRNMIGAGVPLEDVFTQDDLEYVQDSQIYPFQFYQAYLAVKNAGFTNPFIEDWLSEATEIATDNIDDDFGNSLVGVDVSGSMNSNLSAQGATKYVDISALFGATLWKKGADIEWFSTDTGQVNPHHDTPLFEVIDRIRGHGGNGTNGWKVIQNALQSGREYDRIILFTDLQIWDNSRIRANNTVRELFDQYRERISPETNLYMVDLSSYGDLVTPEGYQGVYNLQGWNSKIIDWIENIENTGEMIREIEDFDPSQIT